MLTDEDQIEPETKRFLSVFPEFVKLQKETLELRKEIENSHNIGIFDTSKILEKIRIFQDLISEQAAKNGTTASFVLLDRFHKYRILQEILLVLIEDLREDITAPDAEVRGVYFLYMLSRFVESERRFPRKTEEFALLNSNEVFFENLGKVLQKATKESSQVRSDIRKQRESSQRNSVGIGSDQEDKNFASRQSEQN